MYKTCIFCHSALGANEAIENFPVGRRLAFDSSKGRLWAVCAKCGRWNLTPIEERWEAIEECEREYRATRKRSSTGEIGLGRLAEGTDLIRIGHPLRPEFAAWRYAPGIRKRATLSMVGMGAGVATAAALMVGTPLVAVPMFAIAPAVGFAFIRQGRVRVARRYLLRRASMIAKRRVWDEKHVEVRIVPSDHEQGWALRFYGFTMPVDLTGRDAVHTVHMIMPAINMMGGFRSSIRRAVEEIEQVGEPDRYFQRIIDYARVNRMKYAPLNAFPAPMRLAIEMASNEESERHALEGELRKLEDDWREAEEIAAIADDLFIPRHISDFVEKHRA